MPNFFPCPVCNCTTACAHRSGGGGPSNGPSNGSSSNSSAGQGASNNQANALQASQMAALQALLEDDEDVESSSSEEEEEEDDLLDDLAPLAQAPQLAQASRPVQAVQPLAQAPQLAQPVQPIRQKAGTVQVEYNYGNGNVSTTTHTPSSNGSNASANASTSAHHASQSQNGSIPTSQVACPAPCALLDVENQVNCGNGFVSTSVNQCQTPTTCGQQPVNWSCPPCPRG